MTAQPITSPTTWPSADALPDVLWGAYNNDTETFEYAYDTQREAEEAIAHWNYLASQEDARDPFAPKWTVDQLPQPFPDWAVR